MEQYISKAAVVAEIEKLRKKNDAYDKPSHIANVCYKEILSLIDTFEVRGVDLEKHLKEDIEDVFFDLNGVAVKGATHYLTVEDVKDIAKHFYSLGLKVQKGEKV